MVLDKEKVLTVSASDYARSFNRSVWLYDLIGVHVNGQGYENPIGRFLEKVPEDVEAVVAYRVTRSLGDNQAEWTAYGTALRRSNPKEPDNEPEQ